MAQIRMEVRDRFGNPLPDLCDDILDLRLPVDHSGLAQSLLRILRNDGGGSIAHSVHFFRDGDEIGSWSLERESAEAPRADNVIRLRRPAAA
jgi:hypothetical protein